MIFSDKQESILKGYQRGIYTKLEIRLEKVLKGPNFPARIRKPAK